jgi:hypothetical protein
MGKGQNRTGGKKGKRAGGANKKYGANNKDVLDITAEQSVAELVKHYGGTPPRFKGVIMSSKNNGREIRVVKPGSTRGRIQVGDIALVERNIANSISSDKQEYHILTILRKDQIRQLKQKGIIVREEKSKYDEEDEFDFDVEGAEEEIIPQQRRYSLSSDDEFDDLIGERTNESNGTTDELTERMDKTKVKETPRAGVSPVPNQNPSPVLIYNKKVKDVDVDTDNDDDDVFCDEEVMSIQKTKEGKILEIDTSDEITNLISHTPPVLSDEEKRQLKKMRRKSPLVKNF